jgi:hypothetical protein
MRKEERVQRTRCSCLRNNEIGIIYSKVAIGEEKSDVDKETFVSSTRPTRSISNLNELAGWNQGVSGFWL